MLVLKRKVGEVIRIENDIEVHVLGVEGDVIKLGFNAPKHISILRSEIFEAIKEENMKSIVSNSDDTQETLKRLGLSNKKPKK